MKNLTLFGGMVWLVMLLSSCVSPFSKVEHPATPFARPEYSIKTPPGDGWEYSTNDSQSRYRLTFYKALPDPKFHSLIAGIVETPNSAEFENPEEFVQWMEKTIEGSMNPNQQRLLDKRIELDRSSRFGSFTVKFYTKSEDHRADAGADGPWPILIEYGYVFVHPSIPNRIIKVAYSERGRPSEIRPNVAQEAEIFFNGIEIRNAPAGP